jgi:mono/diheme cytochrome c family protein
MSRVSFLSIKNFFILICIILSSYEEIQAQDKGTTQLSGKELFIKYRCVRCHTIGRGRFVGPDLKGVSGRYGKDEIKRWIVNPQEIYQSRGKMPLNEGYPPMPPLNVSPREAELIADYITTVKTPPLSKDSGVIKGKVVNNSTEKALVDTDVILTAYLGDKEMGETVVKTNGEGIFEFKNLAWDRSYSISLKYEGGEYITDKLVFSPEEVIKTLDLPVYESTDSDRYITVNISHMIVQISETSLSVAELMVFHNSGKRVYVGSKEIKKGRRETLKFSLPPGASDIQYLSGLTSDRVVGTNQGFVDTSSIEPGIKRVIYAYTLPFESGKDIIEKVINNPTDSFVLLVSDTGAEVKVDGLAKGGATEIPDQGRFLQWSGAEIPLGTKIRIEIGDTRLLAQDYLKFATFGVLAIVVVIGVLYSFIIKPNDKSKAKDASLTIMTDQYVTRDLEEERKILIREIAELDDSFEAKEITEEEYTRMRSIKKGKLVEITRKIKES